MGEYITEWESRTGHAKRKPGRPKLPTLAEVVAQRAAMVEALRAEPAVWVGPKPVFEPTVFVGVMRGAHPR